MLTLKIIAMSSDSRDDEEDDEKLIVVRKLKLIRFLYINIIINY